MLARRPVTSDNTVVKGAIRQLLRSSGAVVAGLAVTVLLSGATDMAMPMLGVFGPDGMPRDNGSFIVATLYRLVYSIDGWRIAARLTPAHPMRHAIVLSLIGLELATIGLIVGAGHGPVWYPLALLVTALPCAWLGGRLARRKNR